MSLFHDSALVGASGQAGGAGYFISRSIRLNEPDSAYLSRTPASAGNRKTFTWAGWIKRSALGGRYDFFGAVQTGSQGDSIAFNNDKLWFFSYNGGFSWQLLSTAVFRDTSAWMHVCVALNTDAAIASDRAKMYVNGVQITAFDTTSYPTSGFQGFINLNVSHGLGVNADGDKLFSGYLADVHFIDGQALTPSSFGEFSATTGVWVPKAYSGGSYGSQGWHLDFADNSSNTATTLGKDSSGLGNHWTPNNLSVTAGAGNDSLIDVPVNGSEVDTGLGNQVRGNYAVLNPLANPYGSTLSNGNLDVTTSGYGTVVSSIVPSSGKWYWEVTLTGGTATFLGGIVSASEVGKAIRPGLTATSYAYDGGSGLKYNNSSGSSYGASFGTGDIIGVALDLDAGQLTFYKNGVSQGVAFTGLSGGYAPAIADNSSSGDISCSVNFGQRQFAYPVAGYKSLNTASLPAPQVTKPSDLFDVKLYTGNGSTQTISGLGFSPDLVWIKSRNDTYAHRLLDTVRGATKILYSNGTDAEDTDASSLTAFNSNGFTLGSTAGINGSSVSFAAWCWDAGNTTVTNTQGSITSSVRANATAGFSVVTYTGTGSNATVGHGLGVAPFMFIVKNRSTSSDWDVYHGSLPSPATNRIVLQSTAAAIGAGGTSAWNSTSPTSTVVSLGSSTSANANGNNHVMYCFAPVNSYSSFGSYVGNGQSGDSAPFIWTGFRPRWLMVKMSSAAGFGWLVVDAVRNSYNYVANYLYANTADSELANVADLFTFTANGFKVGNSQATNTSAATYIYCTFAESPFAANNRAR